MHYQDPSLNALKLGQQTQYAEKYDRTLCDRGRVTSTGGNAR